MDEMYEDNPEYREEFFKVFSIDSKLTPLELAFFKKVYELRSDLADETVDLDQHQVYDYVSDIFNDIMKNSNTLELYHSWVDEHQKQEALVMA